MNLVDNMVKLGSLYNRNTANGTSNVSGSRQDLMHENTRDHRDRLEFNQRVQEQRLLAEERRDWDRLSPDHGQLQVIQLLLINMKIPCGINLCESMEEWLFIWSHKNNSF